MEGRRKKTELQRAAKRHQGGNIYKHVPPDIWEAIAYKQMELYGDEPIIMNINSATYTRKYNITYLRLYGNLITDILLQKFTCLKTLILPDNTALTNNGLIGKTDLIHLELPNNININDSSLKQVPNLEYLHLNGQNNIFINLRHLTSLILEICNLSPSNWVHFTNIHTLILKQSRVGITDNDIRFLQNIKILELGNSVITAISLPVLGKLESLKLNDIQGLTNNNITNLQNIRILSLTNNTNITDEGISKLTDLEVLKLQENKLITDGGLSHLSNLQQLILMGNRNITNLGIYKMKYLNLLELKHNNIDNYGLRDLTELLYIILPNNSLITYVNENVIKLVLHGHSHITDLNYLKNLQFLILKTSSITRNGLYNCVKLTTLKLDDNTTLDDEALSHLRDLTQLLLPRNNIITDVGLRYINNVVNLQLDANTQITDQGLSYIPKIRKLYLSMNNNITNTGLSYIPNVKVIFLKNNTRITNIGLSHIKNVEYLILSNNINITNIGLRYLENVEYLDISNCTRITKNGILRLPATLKTLYISEYIALSPQAERTMSNRNVTIIKTQYIK